MSALQARNLQHIMVRGKMYTSFEIWEDKPGGWFFSGVFKIPGWYKRPKTVLKNIYIFCRLVNNNDYSQCIG